MKLTKKQHVAALSIISNTTLICLKTIVGIMNGSVSIISEAIHSGMDLIASLIAYLSVTISGKPADESHPYGHGKIENISGVVEGLLIFIAAFLIIKEAIERIIHPAPLEATFWGIGVMLLSALANSIVAIKLYKTAKAEDSVALEADALHLKTDVYTSLGVAFGLLIIKLTGIVILDSIVAILVALLIVREAAHLVAFAFQPLLDGRLSKAEEQPIKETLEHFQFETKNNVRINYFKTRKSGSQRFVDFHLGLSPEITIKEGHEIAEGIRSELYSIYPDLQVHIHLEAYSHAE